ncbi:Serpin domain-containing protein [Cladochytrium replicatum]|nr:Serpin domain-containing protein [Cladochytrium replicatum]
MRSPAAIVAFSLATLGIASIVHGADQDVAIKLSNSAIRDFLPTASPNGPSVSSPLNIFHALSLLLAGAKNTTAFSTVLEGNSIQSVIDGMSNLIQTSIPSSLTTTNLTIASAAFLNPDHVGEVPASYNASVARLNGTVILNRSLKADDVNGWISARTRGKIDKIVSDGDVANKSALVSALYFQDHWGGEFVTSSTPISFATLPNSNATTALRASVPAMSSDVNTVAETTDFIAFSKSFLSNETKLSPFRAYFFMAKREIGASTLTANAIPSLAELSKFDAQTVFTEQNTLKKTITVHVPAVMEISTQLDLLEAWAKVSKYNQLRQSFEFLNGGDFKIDQAIHAAKVRIDKDGFEGAAATVIVITPVSAVIAAGNLTFDRPFGFQIVHTPSNAVLFHGVYTTGGVLSAKTSGTTHSGFAKTSWMPLITCILILGGWAAVL